MVLNPSSGVPAPRAGTPHDYPLNDRSVSGVVAANFVSPGPSFAIDTSVSRQLSAWWKIEEKPSKDIACLTGVMEDSVVVITGATLVHGDKVDGCQPDVIGVVGFIDGTADGFGRDDVIAAMCMALRKQTTWLIAGEVYSVVPVMYSDTYWGPGALVWGCTRTPPQKRET